MAFFQRNRKVLFAVYLVIVFFVVAGIFYAPILFKGFQSEIMTSPQVDSVISGRNFALTGVLGTENKLNVVLSPAEVAKQAIPSSVGNKFTAYSYATIFKLFGPQSWNHVILMTIFIYALAALIFTLVVYKLFGLMAAIIFPLIYSLLPFNGQTAQTPGFYEFALLYFALFTLFYFFGRERKNMIIYLALAGVFLALSSMSREAMLVFLPIFFAWLLLRRQKKELFAIFVPVGLVLAIFWLPSFLGVSGNNDYAKTFVSGGGNNLQWSSFGDAGGSMDPYTFYFDQSGLAQQLAQLEQGITDKNSGFLSRVNALKSTKGFFGHFSVFDYFVVGTFNLAAHLSKFLALEYIGGPIIFLLMLLGFWQLKRQKKELCYFFAVWLAGAVLILSYATLVIRNHLMDFGWVIAALVAMGLASLFPLLQNYFQAGKFSKFIFLVVVLLVLYSLVLADHVYLGRGYDNNANLSINYIAEKINAQGAKINSADVIAVSNSDLYPFLNYLTNKSIVVFLPETVSRLIEEHGLQEAFDNFGVKYIAGYPKEISDQIVANSKTGDLADWIDAKDLAAPASYNQGWFLNIIK